MIALSSLMAWVQSQQGGVTFIDITESEPEHGLVWVVLSTFALIGVALLITVGLGAMLGALRIWILRRFPGNRVNGPEYEVLTRLHLHDRPGPDTQSS